MFWGHWFVLCINTLMSIVTTSEKNYFIYPHFDCKSNFESLKLCFHFPTQNSCKNAVPKQRHAEQLDVMITEITWRGPKPMALNLSFISWTLAFSHWGILPSGSGSWVSDLPNCLSNRPHCRHKTIECCVRAVNHYWYDIQNVYTRRVTINIETNLCCFAQIQLCTLSWNANLRRASHQQSQNYSRYGNFFMEHRFDDDIW